MNSVDKYEKADEQKESKNMTDEQLAELAPWSEKLQSIKNRM